MNWIHKLFNPHCSHCKNDGEDNKICNNCEYLKCEIAKLQKLNNRLLNQILETPIQPEINQLSETPQPLNTSRFIPFSVKRQELESEDRKKAKLMSDELKKNHNHNIEELEKEILTAKVDGIELTDLKLEGSVRKNMRESDAK